METTSPVTVSVTAKPTQTAQVHDVLISITPTDSRKRAPADVCCVIDVSGSMDDNATLKNEEGKEVSHGLTLLDIVKHAVKTIVEALQPTDRLSIVTFSSSADTIFGLTEMTDDKKKQFNDKIDSLRTIASTNIWAGLQTGMDLLNKQTKSGRVASLILLTDGQPTDTPPGGEVVALKKYKDSVGHLTGTLNTFGFGYNINSKLLADLSNEGDGMYMFIPDSSFVGTAFINSISNNLVTFAKNVSVSIEPKNGSTILSVPGYSSVKNDWGFLVNLCTMQHGQSKNVVVRMKIPDGVETYADVTVKYQSNGEEKVEQLECSGSKKDGGDEVEVQRLRLEFVENVKNAVEKGQSNGKSVVESLAETIRASKSSGDDKVKTLLEDVDGQVKEAFSKPEFFNKWGRHYLLSLARAHLLQQCNNFKDPGIQHYGGTLFNETRDQVDELFLKLPAPKPSKKAYTVSSSGSYTYSAPSSTPVNMQYYHSHSNPCFDSNCLVTMSDGTKKAVKEVRRGDVVMTPDEVGSEVQGVVKTICRGGEADLVEIQGTSGEKLLVTPYHPIRIKGEWQFPIQVGRVQKKSCEAVYSFVLKDNHVMIINGIECVGLGHGFVDNDVVKHEFFGTSKVIEDLKKKNGWQEGVVTFRSGCLTRDTTTGLVIGFGEEEQEEILRA